MDANSSGGERSLEATTDGRVDGLWGLGWGRVMAIMAGWLALLGLGSLFVSNPFWVERSASADISYVHAMYLHGLLVGLASLASLVAAEVFALRSRWVRLWILGAGVFATLVGGFVGIFDRSPHDHFWVWPHVVTFFALDSVFIVLFVGFFIDWRERRGQYRSLPFLTGWLAALSLELAALMGHAAGWMLDFGDRPALIGRWASLVGENTSDLQANLIGAHSHEIVVALLALLVAVVAAHFGYGALRGGARAGARGLVAGRRRYRADDRHLRGGGNHQLATPAAVPVRGRRRQRHRRR